MLKLRPSGSGTASTVPEAPRVLVVDDHVINRMILERQLARLGYATASAENGEHALALLAEQAFDLILTDCNMPVMDGRELARHVRRDEAKAGRPRIPIIACTGSAGDDDHRACIAAGMDGFLQKPAPTVALIKAIDRWLPRSGQNEACAEPRSGSAGSGVTRSDHGPVRPEALRILTGGDATMTRYVLASFRRTHEQDAERLLLAVAMEDWPATARLAHRIKGASELLGADDLARVCAELEDTARRAGSSIRVATLQQLGQELDRLQTYLLSIDTEATAGPTADEH